MDLFLVTYVAPSLTRLGAAALEFDELLFDSSRAGRVLSSLQFPGRAALLKMPVVQPLELLRQ